MRIRPLLVTAPTLKVWSLDEAKLHLRISANDEDVLVEQWIDTATQQVEQDTGLRLLTQTVDLYADRFPSSHDAVEIPIAPLQSVTSVKYYDSDAVQQTMTASDYIVDTASQPARIGVADDAEWPTDLRLFQPITIRVVVGWTTAALIPMPLRQAVLLLAGLYERHREAVTVIADAKALPLAYQRLIDGHQMYLVA